MKLSVYLRFWRDKFQKVIMSWLLQQLFIGDVMKMNKNFQRYMNLRKEMELIKTADFDEQEIYEDGRADLSIIYTRMVRDIVNKHGLIGESEDLYSNNHYPEQERISLNTCDDGYKFLLDIYHYKDEDGYGANVFANGDDDE